MFSSKHWKTNDVDTYDEMMTLFFVKFIIESPLNDDAQMIGNFETS